MTGAEVLEAEDPETDPSRLTELGASGDKSVRSIVAGNPSTPVAVLVKLADDPWDSVRNCVAVNPSTTYAQFKEAQSASTDAARLAELAASEDRYVRDAALVHPSCPNEVREASGLVFMFALRRASFSNEYINMMVTSRDFTRDLAAISVDVLCPEGGAEQFEIVHAAGVLGGERVEAWSSDYEDDLVWCGSSAPDWWSDWSLIEDFLDSDVVAALARSDNSLFEDNEFKVAERIAFSGHEETRAAWTQIRGDLATVFATGECSKYGSEETVPSRTASSQELEEVAGRWLREDSWREVSETAHRAVLSTLARHPNTPLAVLKELAVSDRESVRWLVTRNPSATDEIRASAVVMGVDDDNFTNELPDEDFLAVPVSGVHVAVHASAWTRERFADEFPETFGDPNDGWVTADGQVTVDSSTAYIPDQIQEFLNDFESSGLRSSPTSGSVAEFE